MIKLSRTVIVAGDVRLAEEVCARLRKPGFYLPLIEEPMVRMVEHGVFHNDCIRVANAIRALKPKTLLFLGVRPEVAAELGRRFPDTPPVFLNDFDETILAKHLKFTPTPVRSCDLLIAGPGDCASDLFVVEGEFDVSHVIAANLAVAHGGRVLAIAHASKDEVELIKQEFRTWSNGSSDERTHAKEAVLGFTRDRLPQHLLDSSDVRSISFITKGIPYGVLPFRCPTTHYFSFPLLGVSVLSGMLKSLDDFRCPVAVLIDPQLVGQSEFETLRTTLGKAGYHLRLAHGKKATVQSATYLCQHLPSDFIFFSTHCGEVTGRRIVERFSDRNDHPREICYDLAISACPAPGSDLIEVLSFISPVSLDGVSWADEKAKTEIRAGDALVDFLKISKESDDASQKREIISTKESPTIKGSDALGLHGGNYFPLPQVVGGYHYPVVFNNACSSWRGLAMNFGCGGAACYVGTATLVLNPVAVAVGSAFIRSVTTGKCIGIALFRSQKQFSEQFGYTPYLMHGYLHTHLCNPTSKLSQSRVIQRLAIAIETTAQNAGKKGVDSALSFLEQELAGVMRMTER